MNCPARLLFLSGELALPIYRVARVSRLIGNSDTTAKGIGWQEKGGKEKGGKPEGNEERNSWFEFGQGPPTHTCAPKHETPLRRVAFLNFVTGLLDRSLAPLIVGGRGLCL
jgi:hypothetical protein